MASADGWKRREFFQNLLSALWPPSNKIEPMKRTFAASNVLKNPQGFFLKSFHVEGAGLLELPLSVEGASKLRSVCDQASFGESLAPVLDTDVPRYWQVDASKVTFPGTPIFLSTTIQPMAMNALSAMGVDGLHWLLQVHLSKLVFYEAGAHSTFHRDTEEEEGVFATFILQLPTEEGYRVGKMTVKREKKVKEFDFQKFGALYFCCCVFFADCLHEMQEIISGTKLCLVFNLVKRNSSMDPTYREFISSQVHKVEAALEPWLEAAGTTGKFNYFPRKLFFQLRHKYSERSFSIAKLKGDDEIMAEVLKNCKDKNKEKLDLHLCLVTTYERGDASPRSGQNHNCSSECHHSMRLSEDAEIDITMWIGLDTKPVSAAFKDLSILDTVQEVVSEGEDIFYSQPDEEEYTVATAHDPFPVMEHWYHRFSCLLHGLKQCQCI